jgi:hypothetical protein
VHVCDAGAVRWAGKYVDLSKCEIHTVAGLLKNYFRSAETPLLTYERYEDFIQVARMCVYAHASCTTTTTITTTLSTTVSHIV